MYLEEKDKKTLHDFYQVWSLIVPLLDISGLSLIVPLLDISELPWIDIVITYNTHIPHDENFHSSTNMADLKWVVVR